MPTRKVFFKNSKGMKLAAWLHVPEGKGKFPAVIRAHGYKSSKDSNTGKVFAEKLADFVFLRFDFHGHGESEGNPKEIDAAQAVDDLMCAIDFVCGLPYVNKSSVAVVGSSFGGLASTLAAARSKLVAAAVPVCPVSDFEPFRVRNIKYSKLLNEVGKTNVYHEAENITCPVLVIHGDKDDIVPIEQSIELVKHIKNGKLHVVKGANHDFSDPKHFEDMIGSAGCSQVKCQSLKLLLF